MAGTNEFKPFATDGAANVLSQAAYAALTSLISNGFQSGVADSAQVNKVLRQATFGTAALGKIIADANLNAVDDGDLATFVSRLLSGIQVGIQGRTRLTAPLTLYVSPSGNDSNSGLNVGSPLLTIQEAFYRLAKNYDLSSYPATIQLADGTYTMGLSIVQSLVGQAGVSGLILNGNSGTPSNVVISTTNADAVSVSAGGAITLSNLKIQTTTSGNGVLISSGGFVTIGSGVVFGACATSHINNTSGQLGCSGNYSIVGSAPVHWKNGDGATTVINGVTITLTGTPAFSSAFAQSYNSSILNVGSITFSGAATGTRYSASMNGVINVNGGGATYLPGSVAGSVATGGQYA